MGIAPIKHYGVKEQLAAADELEVKLQELDLCGYTVMHSGFSEAVLSDLRERLERLLSEQEMRFGGYETLKRINEGDTLRAPLIWDEAFLNVAVQVQLIDLCRRALGDYFIINQQNGVRNPPVSGGHHQTRYHRDLPYQHFVSSRPLALNALLCLDPFTVENGATRVLPGSHKIEYFPDDRVVRSLEVATNVPAGAYLILNSMVFHCAGVNRTEGPRRAINTVFTVPIIKQQIALPPNLEGRYANDPWLRRLLGFEVDPPRSLEAWFESRKSRKD
ncbi:MAG: phytanoyl-CoA dioxygenase family protein [Nitrospira sp.]|nr:phytanoyl-CoA dioxygenase family protein [Nitrospira sp.]